LLAADSIDLNNVRTNLAFSNHIQLLLDHIYQGWQK